MSDARYCLQLNRLFWFVSGLFMVLTTPGIPWKILEIKIFFPGPWKTPWKTDNFPVLLENSLKTPWKLLEFCGKNFISYINKTNLQKHLTRDCSFCILCRLDFSYCYCGRNYLTLFCFSKRRIWCWVLEKQIFYPGELLENSWKTPGILLTVSEHLVSYKLISSCHVFFNFCNL